MSVALYQLSNKFGIKLRSDVCRDCRRSNRLSRRASGQDLLLSVVCCLLPVVINRSVEPNTGKRNQVNSTRNRRIELKAKYSWAVRKD